MDESWRHQCAGLRSPSKHLLDQELHRSSSYNHRTGHVRQRRGSNRYLRRGVLGEKVGAQSHNDVIMTTSTKLVEDDRGHRRRYGFTVARPARTLP
jgi:hypothetical protein